MSRCPILRKAVQYMLHISSTVEDYVRIVGSVKVAYAIRLKAYEDLCKLEGNLTKRRETFARLEQQHKLRTDKIQQAKTASSTV
jgi:sorting nexin-1/2